MKIPVYTFWIKAIFMSLASYSVLWLGGFFLFVFSITHIPVSPTKTDALIILSGSKGRIQAGLSLAEEVPHLPIFISGIYKQSQLEEIFPYIQENTKIKVDYKDGAGSENIESTKKWAEELSTHQSLKVVTSHYRMPRSLLELKKILPQVTLVPYPVVPNAFQATFWWVSWRNLSTLIVEYNKYAFTYIFSHFG